MTMINVFKTTFKYELLQVVRSSGELLNPILFFVMVISLFPLAIGPEPTQLKMIAPGVIWVAALLATLLTMPRLFQNDWETGCLDQLLITPQPLFAMVFAKIITHWLHTGLALIVFAPILGVLFHLHSHTILILLISLLLGTPILSFLGAVAAALLVSTRGQGMLLPLLLLPLYIPVLIFGVLAVQASMHAQPPHAYLALLGALLILTIMITPFAVIAALRIGVE